MFAPPVTRQPSDPLLTESPIPGPSPSDNPTRTTSGPTVDPAAPPSPSTDDASPRTRTSTEPRWKAGGDPDVTAKALGGLFVLLVTAVSLLYRGRGKTVRRPTDRQRDDVAVPLARVACHHLPMDLLNPDLLDGIAAATAVYDYATDGPLIEPITPTTNTVTPDPDEGRLL